MRKIKVRRKRLIRLKMILLQNVRKGVLLKNVFIQTLFGAKTLLLTIL